MINGGRRALIVINIVNQNWWPPVRKKKRYLYISKNIAGYTLGKSSFFYFLFRKASECLMFMSNVNEKYPNEMFANIS